MNKPRITIYTDGACSGNPGPGGWGAVLLHKDKQKDLSGYRAQTTNNQMELQAAIEALKALKESCSIDFYVDSKYVKDGVEEWLANWKAKNWKTANKKPVKNKELWEALDSEVKKHTITWHWVKGHAGDKWNEYVDTLATQEIEKNAA